jgi:hypothetical protein
MICSDLEKNVRDWMKMNDLLFYFCLVMLNKDINVCDVWKKEGVDFLILAETFYDVGGKEFFEIVDLELILIVI